MKNSRGGIVVARSFTFDILVVAPAEPPLIEMPGVAEALRRLAVVRWAGRVDVGK